MARTWDYTRRNRLPLKALDAVGRRLAGGRQPAGTRQDPARPGEVRRILVVEFWNIGDVVLTMPFLAQLRAIFPAASITLLARRHAAELLENSDLVDEVIPVDFPWTAAERRYDPRRYDWPGLRSLFQDLRGRRFDIAFESRMDPRAKMVLALSGAQRRVGFDFGGCNWLLTDAIAVAGFDRHRVEDWYRLLEPFGGPRQLPTPRLAVSGAESGWARDWLAARGIRAGQRLVAVHPGASGPGKRWPVERFAAVIREILDRGDVRVIAIEDPHGYGAELANIAGVSGVRPTLRQLLALLAVADVLVCNDSGPMHMAAMVGTPTVAIFHPHAAREFAPLGDGHHALKPDFERPSDGFPPAADALLGVNVAAVVAAVGTVLGQSSPSRCATGS